MSYITARPVAQGEADFWKVDADHFADQTFEPVAAENGHLIVAHSESGHHHVIDRDKAELYAAPVKDSDGFRLLKLIVKEPTEVRNLAPSGHEDLKLDAGIYEVRIARELGLDDVIRRAAD